MPAGHGDLVLGDVVVIPFANRHVYTKTDPIKRTRTCLHCDLQETKPWLKPAVEHEQPCPKTT